MPITVWIIEDNVSFRTNAAAAINDTDGLACSGAYRSCEEALPHLRGDKPNVILMDIGLPGMSGIEGIQRVHEFSPDVQVIVLTVFEDEDKLFKAICAGASGYLLKGADLDEIAEAIRLAHEGGSPMTPRIARRVLGFFTQGRPKQPDYGLTDREKEILRKMADGLIKKEIADAFAISIHTVNTHIRSIYEKLQVNTNTGAVAKALREDLI